MVAVADEDLLPGDPVMVAARRVMGRCGAGGQRAEIGPGLRLGQVHRAGPLAGNQLTQVEPLLLRRAIGLQQLDRRHVQQRAQRKAHAGRVPHLGHRCRERQGQPLSAKFRIGGEPVPAALDMAGIGLAKPRGGAHHAVFEDAADPVGRLVQRRQHGRSKFRRLTKDRADQLRLGHLVAGQQRHRADSRDLIEHKAHLGDRGGIGHRSVSRDGDGAGGDPRCSRLQQRDAERASPGAQSVIEASGSLSAAPILKKRSCSRNAVTRRLRRIAS